MVNYHSKKRYDGHQSDNVIAVKISDMSAYPLPNDTFSGHSFNQSLIYSKKSLGFLFASQGDAYARGFRVNNSSGRYGDDSEILFHFYLEANSNYDMYIVNTTFAQLGGLVETSKGVALVGASAKSISEKAKSEKQGRHRYYGIQDQEVAQVMESLLSIAPPIEIKSLKQSIEDKALRYARTCYDHLAGSLGVQLTNTLLRTRILREEKEGFTVTENGEKFFTSFQIDLEDVRNKRRSFSHRYLDWSERRHHLAGALGNALLEKFLELNWVQRLPESRAVKITTEGKIGFKEVFSLDINELR